MGNFWKSFFRILAVIFLIGTINAIIQGVVDGKIYPATLFFAVIIAGAFCFLVYKVADYREKFRVLKDLEQENLDYKNRLRNLEYENDIKLKNLEYKNDIKLKNSHNRVQSLLRELTLSDVKHEEKLNSLKSEYEDRAKIFKGFYLNADLSTEDINLFKEIELENITDEIKNDNFQKLLIRKREILSELRTGLSMLYKYGEEFSRYEMRNFIPISIMTTDFFLDVIRSIEEKGLYMKGKEKREHVLNILYNDLVLFSEEILYKYEIFKKEYLPKIKVDLELIARVEEAKKFQLLQNMEEEDKQASRHIPQKIKDIVWNRDGGKCVECGSNQKIEFDHIIPFSKGGANTARNLQLLCESCNRSKSDKIG